MEKNLSATFKRVDDLEHAADELRRQGVLNIRFDDRAAFKVDYQSDTFIQSAGDYLSNNPYALQVSVEMSRYRQAEDTITKYGGEL